MTANRCHARGCRHMTPNGNLMCSVHQPKLSAADRQKRIAGARARVAAGNPSIRETHRSGRSVGVSSSTLAMAAGAAIGVVQVRRELEAYVAGQAQRLQQMAGRFGAGDRVAAMHVVLDEIERRRQAGGPATNTWTLARRFDAQQRTRDIREGRPTSPPKFESTSFRLAGQNKW